MPARSVAFANLRGGCGKSTILFQLASEFAKAHSSTGVLVIDCTAFGDVSRLLLGGRQPGVKQAVGAHFSDGKSTSHLLSHLLAPAATAAAGLQAAPGMPAGIASMPAGLAGMTAPAKLAGAVAAGRGAASWAAAGGGATSIAERFGLPVCEANPSIPMPNLLLIPSGATKQQPCSGVGGADILRLARSLKARLDALPGDWQVFLDTDGDLTFSPATEVALRAADLCYIPYQPTESDHDRATEAVSRLQRLQPAAARVGGVIFNMVTPEPRPSSEGWPPFSSTFRPHELAVRRMVDHFSGDWWERAQAQPASFAATASAAAGGKDKGQGGAEREQQSFMTHSVTLMQDFGKPGNLAAELGIPFCSMSGTAKYRSGDHTESLGGSKKLAAVEGNVRELRLMIEETQARLAAAGTNSSTADLDRQLEAAAAAQLQAQAQEAASEHTMPSVVAPKQAEPKAAEQEASSVPPSPPAAASSTASSAGSAAMVALAAAALVAVSPAAAPAAALAAAVIAGREWMRKQ